MTKTFTYFHYFTLFWGTIFWHSMTDNYFMIRYQVKNNIMYLFYYLTKAWVIKLIEFTVYLSWEWNCFPLNHQDFCKNHLHSFNMYKSGRENLDEGQHHSLKSVQIRSYFWSVFSCIQSGYRKIRTTNISASGHFSRSVYAMISANNTNWVSV